jgi:alpha-L-fucosidase
MRVRTSEVFPTLVLILAACVVLAGGLVSQAQTPPGLATPAAPEPGKPTPEQVDYHAMELQMFVCLDPCTWQNREYDNHSTPLNEINPAKLDTAQWCKVAKSWGARQVLFVAKHTGGFCWWQTDTSAYGIKNTPWKASKGDVLAELAQSCRLHGLKLGVYIYPGDDQWGAGSGSGGRTSDPAKQEAYTRVFRQQLTEVLSRYGEVAEVWFDGSCVIEVGDLIRQFAPRAMVFQGPHTTLRWVGNEAGLAPYPAWQTVKRAAALTGTATAAQSDPEGDVWLPMECDTTLLDHKWFWGRNTDHMLKSLDQLMDVYYRSVGRGCVLLLNSSPDTTGLVPESHVGLYEAFGREIARRFGRSVAETFGRGQLVELDLGREEAVNHVMTMEDIRQGQRVRGYRVEGLSGGVWKTLVAAGESIGYKQIDLFPTAKVSRVRLVVTRCSGEPLIKRFAVFGVEGLETGLPLADAVWAFDEGQGDVPRASPAGQGRVRGAQWTSGKHRGALAFDGKDSLVGLGPVDFGSSDFTMAAWVFPRANASGQARIIARERIGVSDNQFRLYLHEGNRLGFMLSGVGGAGTPYPFVTAPGSVPCQQWTHLVVTRRGRECRLFLNGQEAARTESREVVSHGNRLDLRVGAAYAAQGEGAGCAFDGVIDDVRIYGRALTGDELADPEALPEPGWIKGADWASSAFSAQGALLDLDVTAGVPRPGRYEARFQAAPQAADLQIESIELMIGGQVISNRVQRLADPHRFSLFRMEQTTHESPTLLRVMARIGVGKPGGGAVWLRLE